MALTSSGYYLNVELRDQGGNKAVLRYDVQGVDYAGAQASAAIIIAALDPVTTGLVYAYWLGEKFVEDTLQFGVGEIENLALVVAKLTAPGKTVNIKIPAPEPGLFVGTEGPDFNEMDPGNALTQAYLAVFEAGAQAQLSDGETIRDSATSGNWTGKRIHRGSRKG